MERQSNRDSILEREEWISSSVLRDQSELFERQSELIQFLIDAMALERIDLKRLYEIVEPWRV